MKKAIRISIFFLFAMAIHSISQELPLGYIKYYSGACDPQGLLESLRVRHEENWEIDGANCMLSIHPSDSTENNTIPGSMGVLGTMIFGEYIAEFEFKQSAMPDGDTTGFCFLGVIKSVKSYYAYVFTDDSISFFFIDDGIPELVDKKPGRHIVSGWNKVRIRRDILSRNVYITLNKNHSDEITFNDRNLVMGYLGFGTHRTKSHIRNLTVWAPTSITDTPFKW